MKSTNTANRLKELMATYNWRQIDILNKCMPYCQKYNVRLGRNDISQYISGKVEPGQDKLSILGMALNVSEAWLMGFDVPKDRNASGIEFYRFSKKDFLSSAEGKKLIESYLSLSEEGQKKLMEYCDLLLSSDKYKTAYPRNDYQLTLFPDKFSVPYRPSALNAAHAETEASPEDKKHDEDIMNDDTKWGN